MSRIVFFCIPAHGHTNPTLEVVRELISRGNEVIYYSYDIMRDKIEETGAKFVSCDKYDYEKKLSQEEAVKIGRDIAFSTEILVNTTLAIDDAIFADMKKLEPDCVVADSMAVWGKAIAMKLGIPFVSSTTTFAFNKYSAKIMKQSPKQLFSMIFSMPKINRNIKRLQNKGYPVKNVLDIIQNDENTDTIVYTSPEFQPFSETFSEKYAFVGPSVRPAVSEIEKTKEKLVYISMGTVNNDMLSFYKNCISAFTETKYQVIISVGNIVRIDELGKIPDNISVYHSVDQIAVLQKADVFVSHCGMNSASESLYFGVPLVMLPQTPEQGGVAERVKQLGAGIKPEKADSLSVLNAVERLLGDKAYAENAAKISRSFRKCGGAKSAADKILSVCKK
ncbi:MAG: glucosyltransferase [Oscillospiraceae bacterium]|nr:glucosyltransferase [Oscillospiraceae bacterium]